MDSGTLISGGTFIFFCIILFVVINRNKQKREKQFLLPLYALAEKDNCKISKFDIWNNSVIGIDEVRNFVFVIKKTIDNETSQRINLAEIQRCRLIEASRITGPKEGNLKACDRIDLAFISYNKNTPDYIVEFYNSNTDRLTLTGELQLAEKWCEIVNIKISVLAK